MTEDYLGYPDTGSSPADSVTTPEAGPVSGSQSNIPEHDPLAPIDPLVVETPPPLVVAPINQRIITWNEKTGEPELAIVPMLSKTQVQKLITATVSQQYEPLEDEGDKYAGMTNMEVMVRKLVVEAARTGDKDDVEKILDRLLGKSKQMSETKTIDMTYADFVGDLARQAKDVTPSSSPMQERIIDATPVKTKGAIE